jgi:hypothetical protein
MTRGDARWLISSGGKKQAPHTSLTQLMLLRFTGFFAVAVLAVGCGSTETTPAVTGVWGGRIAILTPNDSFAFSFKQSGAEVEVWGNFYFSGSSRAPAGFEGAGTLSRGELNLALTGLERNREFPYYPTYFLRGPLKGGEMDAVFESGGNECPITLRLSRPTAPELVGTWVLKSTTGVPAPAGLIDTIIVNADGRAYRHREGDFSFETEAIWSRRADSLVLQDEVGVLTEDSFVVQSGELQRAMVTSDGMQTDHYTRVSTAAILP